MRTILFSLCALFLGSAVGLSQIKRYTLDTMVEEMTGAVFGEITDRTVFRVDDPIDGPELFFTTLHIAGSSMLTNEPFELEVTYHGGFINDEEGVYNSEAPAEDDVQIGNQVVVFYKWADNMGGGVSANALMAAHGGIYRTAAGPRNVTVLGRGDGYAVNQNIRLDRLAEGIQDAARRAEKKGN